MLTGDPLLIALLDRELIGFVTAVDPSGQPQTSPVWYIRDREDLVVYNRPRTPRLTSIATNPKVAFSLRGDPRGEGGVTSEGTATLDETLPSPMDFPGYLDKYGSEIERFGWKPESFSSDFPVGLRISITRIRSWELGALLD